MRHQLKLKGLQRLQMWWDRMNQSRQLQSGMPTARLRLLWPKWEEEEEDAELLENAGKELEGIEGLECRMLAEKRTQAGIQ